MKPTFILRSFLTIAGTSLLAVSSASSATYYWDSNNDGSLYGTAQGTWSGTTAGTLTGGWTTSATGETVVDGNSVTTLSTNGTTDAINFGNATASSLLSGTITVSGTVNSGNMTFGVGAGAITLSGGTINFHATPTITTNTTSITTIDSIISGAGTSLTKAGNGTLVLSGANTYTGQTIITAGTLRVGSLSSIGTGTIRMGLSNATGTLDYTGAGESSSRDIQINSSVNTNTGGATILNNGSGALTFTAANFNAAYVNASASTRVLTLGGSNGGEIQGVIQDNSATSLVGLTKSGTGTWVLSGTNTYTGVTSVNGGTLQLKSGASNLTQTLGSLAFAGADGTLESNKSGAGTITTTFSGFTRSTGATGNIVSTGGTNGTDNIVNITGAAGFINAGLYFGGSEFAARNTTDGYVRALAYGSDPNTSAVNTIAANTHVKLTSSTPSAQGNIILFSLNLVGDGVNWTTISSPARKLTVPGIIKSGGGTSTISGGDVAANSGNAELVIRTDTANDTLIISSEIEPGAPSGSNVTKSGAGTLILSGINKHDITNVNGGTLSISANANLGGEALSGRTVNLRGGTLQATATFGLYQGTAGTNNRNVTLTNSSGIDVTSSNTLTVAGVVSGTGSLTKSNTGTLELSGVNTYTGPTFVSAGTLLVSGSLTSDVTVSDGATLAGGGAIDDLILAGGSLFDLFLAVNSADSLAATNISFVGSGFGINNLVANGTSVNWASISDGIYTLITGNLNSTNLENFGLANAQDIGGGRFAYFQDGSLQLVVIPEPSTALLGCLGLLILLGRRKV